MPSSSDTRTRFSLQVIPVFFLVCGIVTLISRRELEDRSQYFLRRGVAVVGTAVKAEEPYLGRNGNRGVYSLRVQFPIANGGERGTLVTVTENEFREALPHPIAIRYLAEDPGQAVSESSLAASPAKAQKEQTTGWIFIALGILGLPIVIAEAVWRRRKMGVGV